MKFIGIPLLATCLVGTPPVFAHEPIPFKILSTSVDGHKKPRSLPDFSLIERSGKRITLADLRGKIWIADFIYTQCTDTCSWQTADMATLQERWTNENDLRLVSISLDPEHDTPSILTRFAARFHANGQRWLFLTGNKKQIDRLVEDGFALPASAVAGRPGTAPTIIHSPRFILIDREGQIRGSYDSRDRQSMQRLNTDVTNLLHGSVSASNNTPSVIPIVQQNRGEAEKISR
jgi:protein SCO1/2